MITALDRIAMPCVRFDSKDVVEWSDEACDCGRTFRIFKGGVVGRADDITKVKGVLLAPSAIEEVVRSFPEFAGTSTRSRSPRGATWTRSLSRSSSTPTTLTATACCTG